MSQRSGSNGGRASKKRAASCLELSETLKAGKAPRVSSQAADRDAFAGSFRSQPSFRCSKLNSNDNNKNNHKNKNLQSTDTEVASTEAAHAVAAVSAAAAANILNNTNNTNNNKNSSEGLAEAATNAAIETIASLCGSKPPLTSIYALVAAAIGAAAATAASTAGLSACPREVAAAAQAAIEDWDQHRCTALSHA
eukprot:CAMPEP_0115118542 /NCGR_PEP_ID=MMETSP0227-20121206/44555_1 /TAXON_ID=89957 /ORGANISM="Polarella glacialis, Strain CCMP 1383" /LENGTH=194 /DNA_ID=CAMNT_0002519835 /DNA_START=43 /DNA_END=628 /DNA_ORIENTATION=-